MAPLAAQSTSTLKRGASLVDQFYGQDLLATKHGDPIKGVAMEGIGNPEGPTYTTIMELGPQNQNRDGFLVA